MLSNHNLLCKKSNCSSILNTHFRQRSSSEDIFSKKCGMQGSPLRRSLSKSVLTALAQQAELPATWANSFASWKAAIAAAILVQVLGEAVLSRVFKHCGHCTPPGLKATMHLPQHPHRIRYGFLLLRELFLWCQLPSASSWTMLSEIEKRGIKISIFIFVSLVSKRTMPLERK